MNWHGVPVQRGTLVPSLGMARCVPQQHARKSLPSELARVPRATRHDRATCAGFIFTPGSLFFLTFHPLLHSFSLLDAPNPNLPLSFHSPPNSHPPYFSPNFNQNPSNCFIKVHISPLISPNSPNFFSPISFTFSL